MIASAAPLFVVVSSIVILAVTGNLFSASPYVIAAQAGAIALSVWARRSFPKESFRVVAIPAASSMISSGPYRSIRHPMYSAALLFIWSGILLHLSRWTLVLGIVVTAMVVARVVVEERLLRRRYPEYDAYARTTKALIPFIA